jgi:two-component system response regulator AtoC
MSATNYSFAPFRILIAEDEPEIRDYLQFALRRPNLVVDFAEDGEEVINALANGVDMPALLILDVMMPRKDGITTLKEIRCHNASLPIIMLSGIPSATFMVEAMEHGANNFLTKPVSYEELHEAIDLLLPVTRALPSSTRGGFTGKAWSSLTTGNWIRQMEPLLKRLATCDVPILLQGETGVGKEVLARHIHSQSLRAGKIFLKINCAALPPELVESELFGYERGAFTGAFKTTLGKFELANGGTILLDEIGDMDLRLQSKLLQVLQDREFHRIGAKEATQVDVRVIAATHRELEARVEQGEFREDLYYRLNVFNIAIPPLRERVDEIVLLATSFLKKHALADTSAVAIGPALRSALLRHKWPGNIRELENVMRKYLVVRSPEIIIEELHGRIARTASAHHQASSKTTHQTQSRQVADTRSDSLDLFGEQPALRATDRISGALHISGGASQESSDAVNSDLARLDQARKAAEAEVILKALNASQWNRKRSAALLGIDYKALLYKMKKLGIQ